MLKIPDVSELFSCSGIAPRTLGLDLLLYFHPENCVSSSDWDCIATVCVHVCPGVAL